jgi:hypothetical protein
LEELTRQALREVARLLLVTLNSENGAVLVGRPFVLDCAFCFRLTNGFGCFEIAVSIAEFFDEILSFKRL